MDPVLGPAYEAFPDLTLPTLLSSFHAFNSGLPIPRLMFILYATLIDVNSLNLWAHEMWDVKVIINGATNSDYKEGVCVEWVWAKGTGKQSKWVRTVIWVSHPKICYPFILMPRLSSKIMDFSNHCVLFITIALTQFKYLQILCRFLINAYWITFFGILQKAKCPATPRLRFLFFFLVSFSVRTGCSRYTHGIPTSCAPEVILIPKKESTKE